LAVNICLYFDLRIGIRSFPEETWPTLLDWDANYPTANFFCWFWWTFWCKTSRFCDK